MSRRNASTKLPPPSTKNKGGRPKGFPSPTKGQRQPHKLKGSSRMVDWDALEALYIHGEIGNDKDGHDQRIYLSLRKMAERFEIPYDTIADQSAKRQWGALRDVAMRKEAAEVSRRLLQTMAGQGVATRHCEFTFARKMVKKLEKMIEAIPDDPSGIQPLLQASNALRKTQEVSLTAIRQVKEGSSSQNDDWTIMRAARRAAPVDVSDLDLLPLANLGKKSWP